MFKSLRHNCSSSEVKSLSYLALIQNRTLLTLELGTNNLTDQAAQLMGDVLKINMTLEGLSLWQNEISAQGAQALAEGLKVRQTHSFSAYSMALVDPLPTTKGEELWGLYHHYNLCQRLWRIVIWKCTPGTSHC